MEELYQTLSNSSIGLFESPTGTGKTLSIICGALHWLEDFRERAKEADAAQAAGVFDDDDPDWLRVHHAKATTSAPEPHPWLKRRGLVKVAADRRRVVQAHTLGAPSGTARRRGGSGDAAAADGGTRKGSVLDDSSDDQFLLAPTAADADGGTGAGGGADAVGVRRARIRALLGEDSDSGEEAGEADQWPAALRALRAPPASPARTPQVFFASRTHSQVAQFVSELRRTGFASRLRLVSLASRKGLCVHEPVASLGSAGLITERCTELQERSKSGSKARKTAACGDGGAAGCTGRACGASSKRSGPGPGSRGRAGRGSGGACPFLLPSLEATEDFAAAVLGEPMDMEDLGRTGRRLGLCPYYGSRSLVSEADVVALPYSALLCEETRGSLGLVLEGSIVIFDEAHNLVDAVTSSHGSQVSAEQLRTAVRQLSAYFSRFQSRLSPASARNVQMLLRLATALQRRLAQQCAQPDRQPPTEQQQQQSPEKTGGGGDGAAAAVLQCHGFLLSMHLEHINLFPLLSWVRESQLVMKVAGYDLATSPQHESSAAAATTAVEAAVDPYDDEAHDRLGQGGRVASCGIVRLGEAGGGGGQRRGSVATAATGGGGFGARRSSLFAFISFLASLGHPSADGRIVIAGGAADADAPCLRYTVLNAAAQFSSILASARSVVLASGTLSPVEGLIAQLLPAVPRHRVRHFSCGHVVPKENLVALVAARGPTGLELDLRHGRRTDPRISEEIGRLLINICTAVPAGMVVFAPSFAYLDQLVSAWRRSEVWSGLTSRKHVFVEPRSAGEVEAVLSAYAAAACQRTTAQPGAAAPATASGSVAGSGVVSGRRPSGAVLLSVVGGKLSEGINFGDNLGRCVVVLGLPYPNPSDPELRERMRYLDEAATAATASATVTSPRTAASGASTAPPRPGLTGRQYYEGLCIKAVNQCVGRVIRHAGDHAAIVLVDTRYVPQQRQQQQQQGGAPGAAGGAARGPRGGAGAGVGVGGGVVGSLPSWIQQSLLPGTGDFAHLYGKLVGFFRARAAAASSDAGAAAAAAD